VTCITTSTPHFTTDISRIDEALAAIESLDEGKHLTYTNIAKTYGVSRVTLARRHQGIQASRTAQAI
jgi:ParB-like chromosome segregation protein Spo0J